MKNNSSRLSTPSSRRAIRFSRDLLSEALQQRAANWVRLWNVPFLLQRICILENSLLRTTIARWQESQQCLELGPQFFRLKRRQNEILCHELAHAAALQIHGQGISPHGPEWHALIEAAGCSPSSVLKISSASKSSLKTKSPCWYEHRCPICHAVRYARRRVGQWRCVDCCQQGLPGFLEINKLKGRP
jgi:SprT protein